MSQEKMRVTFQGKTPGFIQTWHKPLRSKTVERPILIPNYVDFEFPYKKTGRNWYVSITV